MPGSDQSQDSAHSVVKTWTLRWSFSAEPPTQWLAALKVGGRYMSRYYHWRQSSHVRMTQFENLALRKSALYPPRYNGPSLALARF